MANLAIKEKKETPLNTLLYIIMVAGKVHDTHRAEFIAMSVLGS